MIMEPLNFDYSMKNIPIPSAKAYKKKLIEKTESLIKRMRWKAFFFLKKGENNDQKTGTETFGFKSRKCPPQIDELKPLEDDMSY